jgi:hypothetical protein
MHDPFLKLTPGQKLIPAYNTIRYWLQHNSIHGHKNLLSIHVWYVHNSEVEQTRHHLKFRFDNTRTVAGTCQYHAFLRISNTTLIANKYCKAQDDIVVAVAESRSPSQTVPFETEDTSP